MDDSDRPRPSADAARFGAASQLATENLDGYSLDELDVRIGMLEDEIARVSSHRNKSAAHMLAADALFKPKQT